MHTSETEDIWILTPNLKLFRASFFNIMWIEERGDVILFGKDKDDETWTLGIFKDKEMAEEYITHLFHIL